MKSDLPFRGAYLDFDNDGDLELVITPITESLGCCAMTKEIRTILYLLRLAERDRTTVASEQELQSKHLAAVGVRR